MINIKNKKHIIKAAIIIFLLAVGCYFFFSNSEKEKIITIKHGANAMRIGELLKEEGIIKNAYAFTLFLRLTGKADDLKAGTYKIKPGTNYVSLIGKLIKGSEIYVRITIPEGFSVEQIAERLYKNKIIDEPKRFINRIIRDDLRGFLFPETYNFISNQGEGRVIETMRNEFNKFFTRAQKDKAKKLGYTIKEIVTLASLVEKEAKVPAERPVISAIFHKRLKKRIYLESCASVLFALGEHKKRLRYKDLEIESPYNTYRRFGLPPTPICSPGKESLMAALHPADTDYLYFFSKGDGSHIFSKTYKEHLNLQRDFKRNPKKYF
jgi:UPF0755 protein